MSLRPAALLPLVCAVAWVQPQPDDWHRLWTPNGTAVPQAVSVRVSALADLGSELERVEWLMVPTKYHQIHYQPSADAKTVATVFEVIDNLYEFLARRSPAKPKLPVRVFLVPGERGRSRSSRSAIAMRTGADADATFIVSSLMHEETHLFNFAFLGERAQNWWAGEFSCIYHQERARLTQQGVDLKVDLSRRLPSGPVGALASLEGPTQASFDAAASALYFLEETYGASRMIDFRKECLVSSQATNGHPPPASLFRQVFGKNDAELDREWRRFFGWGGPPSRQKSAGRG